MQPVTRHSWTTRLFLRRRRSDGFALALAFALLPVVKVATVALFGFFFGVGCYVILARHRAVLLIDRTYLGASAALAVVALALAAINGSLTSDFRWLSYGLFFLAGAVFFVGWVHVRNPLRQAVLGARAGVVLASILAVAEYLQVGDRVGFGSNQANAAFVLAALAILSRISVPHAPRLLCNSKLWFYLAVLPLLLTGTRTALPLIAVCLLSDAISHFRKHRPGRTAIAVLAIAAMLAILAPVVAVVKFDMPLPTRVEDTLTEFDALLADPLDHMNGLSIRLVLWEHSANIIAMRPWTGWGGSASMQRILSDIPIHPERYAGFIHVHNFILDELRIRGVIGFLMHLAFFVVVFGRIHRKGNEDIGQNAMLLALWMVLYGSLHGLLQADRNVMTITLFVTVVLASINRNRFARKDCENGTLTATGSSRK